MLWGGSDRRRAVADLRVELVRRLGQRRLLQHVVLHDGLLVGVDRGVCVVGVVPRLVSARLIGRLRGQRLFALKAQQLTGGGGRKGEVTFKLGLQLKHSDTLCGYDVSPHLKLGVVGSCGFKPFTSSGEKHKPLSV